MVTAYKSPPENRRAIGLNSLGFVLVTLAAYLSAVVTLGYVLNTISWPRAATLISLGIIYLVNGVYGYAWSRNSASLTSSLNEINKNFGDKTVVNCATCHRGRTRPVGIPPLPSLMSPFVSSVPTNPALPTVDEVLDKYTQALGGKALDKMTSRIRRGSVQVAGVSGTFELHEAAPNKSLFIGSLPPPRGSVHQGFDGTIGWVKNQNGVFEMSGDGLVQAKREANFYADIRLKDQFSAMKVTGRERVGDREVYVIEGTRADGTSEELLFDVLSGFLIRRSWETPTFFGQLPNTIDYDNYKKVGSLRLPFMIRRIRAGTTFLQNISEIKLNAPVNDSMFSKPAAQK